MTTTIPFPGAVELPLISNLVDDHLKTVRLMEGERAITNNMLWRASEVGQCLRASYFRAIEKPRIIERTAGDLRKFAVGDFWSETFKVFFEDMGLLIHDEYELSDDELKVGAHADFIIGNGKWRAGIELKSMQSRYFWYKLKEGGTTASMSHLLQAATYDLLCRRQGIVMPWMVVTVSKDDLTIHQDIVREEHRRTAELRLRMLNHAFATQTPPECECTNPDGIWGGREWKWCGWWPGNLALREKKGAKPDRECCELEVAS